MRCNIWEFLAAMMGLVFYLSFTVLVIFACSKYLAS